MRLAVPCRTTVPGAELRLLVLASSRRGLIGVDLDSGAFVRAHHPDRDALAPFEVVAGRIADGEPFVSPHEPEAADLADAPQRVGRLTGRRAERYLRPLLHPSGTHLMGFPTPTVPYWTLEGDRPSVALLQPDAGPAVKQTPAGFLCRFAWRGADHDLPLARLTTKRGLRPNRTAPAAPPAGSDFDRRQGVSIEPAAIASASCGSPDRMKGPVAASSREYSWSVW